MLKSRLLTFQHHRSGIFVAFLLGLGLWAWPHQPIYVSPSRNGANGSCLDIWKRKINKHVQLLEHRRAVVASPLNRTIQGIHVYDSFEPSYACHTDYRRGKAFGDGGKFVCGDPEYFNTSISRNAAGERCLIYSVGSNGDAYFESDVVSTFHCEVHTFDPTGNSTKYASIVESVGAQFHTLGVSGEPTTMNNTVTGAVSELLPIQDIIQKMGHAHRNVSILKIDCEGCEYAAFASLWPHIQAGKVFIGQIQIELHGMNFGQVARFFAGADEAGYMIFHKERNHWGCDGYKCVEFSLIHKDEARRIFDFTHCNQAT